MVFAEVPDAETPDAEADVDETPQDLEGLQALLDRSYASGGAHLRSILTPATRIDAERLVAELTGVRVLAVATVTAAGEPRVAPVDGLFHRGAWYFGTASGSVRARHLRARAAVSATHANGEEFVVIVHGRAVEIDPNGPDHGAFADRCRQVYGDWWDDFSAGNFYARIDAARLYAGDLRLLRAGG